MLKKIKDNRALKIKQKLHKYRDALYNIAKSLIVIMLIGFGLCHIVMSMACHICTTLKELIDITAGKPRHFWNVHRSKI